MRATSVNCGRPHSCQNPLKYDVASKLIKLLIVDDEPVLVEWLTEIVSRCECETRVAVDGSEAVSVAKEFRPDCVLTGVMMPKMDGFEEARQILEFLPACKFVLMSGSAHLQELRDAHMKLGFDLRLLLTKPFTVAEMFTAEMFTALQLAGLPCTVEKTDRSGWRGNSSTAGQSIPVTRSHRVD